jgi:hypothetical protein
VREGEGVDAAERADDEYYHDGEDHCRPAGAGCGDCRVCGEYQSETP